MKDLLFGIGAQQFQSEIQGSIVAAVYSSGYNPASLETALGKFNVIMNAAGGVLQVFDTGVYTAQILGSDNVDLWTVQSLPTAAKLTPPTTVLHGLGSVGLSVSVNSVGNTSGYSFHWTVTPAAGQPLVGNFPSFQGTGSATDFCSSSASAVYVNDAAAVQALTQLGTDTVSVTVFSAASCNAAKALTKTVTATVSTDPRPGLNVTPANSTIDLGGTVALTATYSDPKTIPASYMWVLMPQNSNDGTLTGQGSNGTNSYCSTSNQATFTSTAPAPLAASVADTVQVTAFNVTGCSSGIQLGNPNSAFITTSNTPHLRLTPANKTIAPGHQLILSAVFRLGLSNPPIPGGYLWTTTGMYGTLSGPGSNGTNSYCSTSARTTYVPTQNASLTQPVTDTVTATPFADASCTGNSDGLTATTTVTIDPAITTISPTSVDTYTGLLLASDGNFYAVSSFGNNALSSYGTCSGIVPDAAYSQCTYLHKIAPDGTDTQLHLFQNDNLNYTTTNSDGFSPNPLVEAGDGNFYGTTVAKGPNATGTIFQITPGGTFTVLYAFPDRQAGQSYAVNPYLPGPLTLGQDGFLYGTSTGVYQDPNAISDAPPASFTVFKIGTNGAYTLLHPMDGTSGGYPTPLIQGDDGNFYTVAIQNTPNNIQLLKISPAGAITIVHIFATDGSEGFPANGALIEGPDHNFYYGSTTTNVFPAGASYQERDGLFKISPTGVVQTLHLFAASEGISTNGDLLFDGVGNLYGSSYYGGNTANCPAGSDMTYLNGTSPAGCGSVFQLTPGGVLNSVYQFTNTARDGANPSGRLVQTADGTLAGTFYQPSTFTTNGIFELTPPLPALIQLSFTDSGSGRTVTTVSRGTPLTLNWQVLNGFSMTAQQCYAFVQGSPTGTGVWTGKQLGILSGTVYFGSTAITPANAGTYTYALTCGGTESGFATIVVQ